MPLLFISFIAGILTALAPCVLPILPVVVGGSVSSENKSRPYIVTASLFTSIILFTLLLKGSTLLISIPDVFWRAVSGVFIIIFGLTLVFPLLWDKLTGWAHIYESSQRALGGAHRKKGLVGSILVGTMLGPVFTSCSPVYLFILSAVLPRSFAEGVLYITAYALGLCTVLLLVGIYGQKAINKFQWAANPFGWFKRGIGILLIIAGLLIITGFDRKIQLFVIEKGILDITKIEQQLLN
jgi:cytochrome c biogenesis protein CcdA